MIEGMHNYGGTKHLKIAERLKEIREEKGLSKDVLASKLGCSPDHVDRIENCLEPIDIVELNDWLNEIGCDITEFSRMVGLIKLDSNENNSRPPLPIYGKVKPHPKGVLQQLEWRRKIFEVLLEGITVNEYIETEKHITNIFSTLNSKTQTLKNREAICMALTYAIDKLPKLNPSDIYQHIIYRLYLREYTRSQADRSWVRAGGEALELFVGNHYTPLLEATGIKIKALISGASKAKALKEMGLENEVGNSKLDVALYGSFKTGYVIFGGIHIKASLAERVSDDVPCSEAMMRKGVTSFLFTFDSKSFPPPHGNLINRGELGSIQNPSDKRNYIEVHGSFDACFSYNLRTHPSKDKTVSGKQIYVSSFEKDKDPLPGQIIKAWESFKQKL